MISNMIELHYLADNAPVSVNADSITHFFEYEEVPLRYEYENKVVLDKVRIRGTRICFCTDREFNVMESYEEVKNKINALKKKEST